MVEDCEIMMTTSVLEPKKLKRDQSRMNLLSLADRLHMSIEEAEQMSVTHFNEWMAYFQIMSEKDG